MEMAKPLTSTFQRAPGFRRIKSKASGRSLAAPEEQVQLTSFLHLREDGKPKTEPTGSPGEQYYVLVVLWLNWRVVLQLWRRDGDRACVAQAVGETEAEAWKEIERQVALAGV